MIDSSTENKLESFLLEAMQQIISENFSGEAGSIIPVNKQKELEKCHQFMMITISSFNFKCIVMLHFPNDAGFKQLIFGNQVGVSHIESSDVFLDQLGEMCNVLSGTLKRKLEYTYSTVGLSTPQLLSHSSLDVFLDKKPDCNINLKVEIGNNYMIISTVLLFLRRDFEFALDSSLKTSDYLDQGDLLLF